MIDHQGQRKTKAVGSREAAERVKREVEARLADGGMEAVERQKPLGVLRAISPTLGGRDLRAALTSAH